MNFKSYALDLSFLNRTALILGLFLIIFLSGVITGVFAYKNYFKKINSFLETKASPEQYTEHYSENSVEGGIGNEAIKETEELNIIKQGSIVLAVESGSNLKLEQIQEMLDDISEKIDILSQKVSELTGEVILVENDTEETKEEEINEDEEEKTEEVGQGEEKKQTKEKIAENAAVFSKISKGGGGGGGGGSGPIEPNYCEKISGVLPGRSKIIINEIAWMGTSNSSNNEWIELKNITNDSIDISNWQVLDKEKQIKIIFESQKSISSQGFYLLERTDDNSVPDIFADYIYSGALNDSDEALYLFDNNCQLQDEAIAEPDWPAGDKDEKKSMERDDNLEWHNYSGAGENGIMGTPKAENSQIQPETEGKCPDINQDGKINILDMVLVRNELGQPFSDEKKDLNNDAKIDVKDLEYIRSYLGKSLSEISVCPIVPLPEGQKILINEVQIDSQVGAGGTDDDWVELYNPHNTDFSLAGWSIQEHSFSDDCSLSQGFYKKNFLEEAVIPAKGFFLIASAKANDLIGELADMKISWSLTDNNTIYLVKNQDEIETGQDSDIVDKIGLGKSCFPESAASPNPPEAKSVGRKELGIDTDDNETDFEIKDIPSPTNSKGQSL